MSNGTSLGKNTLDLFTKWSEGHLGLLNQRQRMFREATQSVLGIVQDSLEMKAPEESVKKLCGNMLELCNLPLNVVGSNGNWEEYTREFRKLVAGTPIAVSGNGFSEEVRAYGKATWENGSRFSSAYVNWMKSLLQGQKLTSDTEEAGRIVRNCLDTTESFIEESVACLLGQVKANSGLLKNGLLKEVSTDQPVQ